MKWIELSSYFSAQTWSQPQVACMHLFEKAQCQLPLEAAGKWSDHGVEADEIRSFTICTSRAARVYINDIYSAYKHLTHKITFYKKSDIYK